MIYSVKNKRAIKFVIRKEAGLIKVFELCNGKWVGPFKHSQLAKRNWGKNLT